METESPKSTPILNIAWARFSELDTTSLARSRSHMRMRRWLIALGVLATLFAILSQSFPMPADADVAAAPGMATMGLILRILLILTPLIGSGLAAFTKIFYTTGDWLITRAGAEEILKEIYFFRTILQKNKSRRSYLEKRLTEIYRQIYRNLSGELIFKPYQGQIPSNYYPDDPSSDAGFDDLTGDEYFKYRVESQLAWHRRKVREYQRERIRLQVLIIAFGVLGAFLAALGGIFSLWVALTASFTAAMLGWQELRNIDAVVRNYSKVIIELTVIYDHWLNLELEERNKSEFYKMVRSTEDILWAQNMEYIKSQQEALKDNDLEDEANLVNRVLKESVEATERTKQAMSDNIVEFTSATLAEAEEIVDETFKAALGSLAEEASSELVQQELAAMSKAAVEMAEGVVKRASSFTSSLADIAKKYAQVEIGRGTSKEELNEILSRFPKTEDVKG